ncbi:hypothetical protein [Salinicola endophyticus]|uniref:hypothetical protein n=1 Tax=Salinicola endophyticus TaxID=1949083 RepID=UPI0013003ECC|nr:hypothetical protein [Salinicola endophyticus]
MSKKINLTGVTAISLLIAQPALALTQPSHTHGAEQPQLPRLSQGARSLINLGDAGLLHPFFSNEKFGQAQSRMGAARFAYGAKDGNPTLDDFREDHDVLITPLNVMIELPASSGASFLRINGEYTYGSSEPHALDLEDELYHGTIEFLHLPNENIMWGVGLITNNFESEDQLSGTKVIRDSRGLRLDYLQKFNDHWGIATRGLYLWGETENRVYDVPTPYGAANLRQKQDDDRYYLQADLVGSWLGDETSWLPDGTLAHPRFGVLYHHSDLGRTTPRLGDIDLPEVTGVNGANEDFGLAWAHFTLQRAPRQTFGLQWLPSATIGIEQEYANTLNELNDESTYAVIGAGLTASMYGQGVFFDYKRYQGVDSDKIDDVFVTGVTLSF